MTKDLVKVSPDRTVAEAAQVMADGRKSCVIVESAGVLVGIITERDIVRKIVADRIDPSKTLASDIMTTPVISISSDKSYIDAAKMMSSYQIRRLAVVDGGKIAGIITSDDLANYVAKLKNHEDPVLNAISRYFESSDKTPYR